jgi:hypothetical protein
MGNIFSTTENIANNAVSNITDTIVNTMITTNTSTLQNASITICESGNDCTDVLMENCILNGCQMNVKQCDLPEKPTNCDRISLCISGEGQSCKNPKFMNECKNLGCNVSDVKLTQTVYINDKVEQQSQVNENINDQLSQNLQQIMKNAGQQSSMWGTLFGSNIGNTTIQEINQKTQSLISSILATKLVENMNTEITNSITIYGHTGTKVTSVSSTQAANYINKTLQDSSQFMSIISDLSSQVDQDIQNNGMWLKIILYILLAVVLIIIVLTIYMLVKNYIKKHDKNPKIKSQNKI